ncbi:unnamed protein product, partial [Cyprideis torosa]
FGKNDLSKLRIPGVLQRFSVAYLVVTVLELSVSRRPPIPEPYSSNAERPGALADVRPCLVSWFVVGCGVALHLVLTLALNVPGCGRGYLGPGGMHKGGLYANCTGGAAGWIDREIFGPAHLHRASKLATIYNTTLSYDPEGALGTLTTILLAYFGVQAGRTLLTYRDFKPRVKRFLIWCTVLGGCALWLCECRWNEGWIPINKNLWSLSFVLISGATSLLLFSILMFILDHKKWWRGGVFVSAGGETMVLFRQLWMFCVLTVPVSLVNSLSTEVLTECPESCKCTSSDQVSLTVSCFEQGVINGSGSKDQDVADFFQAIGPQRFSVLSVVGVRWDVLDVSHVLNNFPNLVSLSIQPPSAISNLSLPSCFAASSQLATLNISNVNLTSVVVQPPLPNSKSSHCASDSPLRTVDLSGNALVSVPASLKVQNHHLHALDLTGNPLKCSSSLYWLLEAENLANNFVIGADTLTCDNERFRGKPLLQSLEFLLEADGACPSSPPFRCECEVKRIVPLAPNENGLMPLISVNCSHRGLSFFPPSLPDFAWELRMEGNNLEAIDFVQDVGNFSHLVNLYLDDNQISVIKHMELTGFAENFRLLSLRGNRFEQISRLPLEDMCEPGVKIHYLDVLNGIMAMGITLLVIKLIYDWYTYRRYNKIPWLARMMPMSGENTIMDSAAPLNDSLTESLDEDSEVMTAAEVLLQLEGLWLNEWHAPDLLNPGSELVECMAEQVVEMERNLKKLPKRDFRIGVHRMELSRIRYILCSYHRIRLEKIENFAYSLLSDRTKAEAMMTAEELRYALNLVNNTNECLESLALRHLPSNLSQLDTKSVFPQPDLDEFVFIKSLRNVPGIVLEEDDERQEEVDLAIGERHVVKYQPVAHLLKNGSIQLI